MQSYALAGLLADVRIATQRNRRNEDLAGVDFNTLMFDETARGCVTDAARMILSEADADGIGAGVSLAGADVEWTGGGAGTVALPDDFFRFLSFRMSDWPVTVRKAGDSASADYAMQHGRYRGLGGVPSRPRVFVTGDSGGMKIEFFRSASEEATVAECNYLPLPVVYRKEDDDAEYIDLPVRMYRAVVNETAALACVALLASDTAAALQEQAKSLVD